MSVDTLARGIRDARSAAALVAILSSGCSLILDFDPAGSEGPPDAPVTDQACMALEPNNTIEQATVIAAGETQAAICGNDLDYFKFSVNGSQSVTARITFMNRGGAGDLDLLLKSADGATVIDQSRTNADVEEVMCPGGASCVSNPLAAGDYLLQVMGFTVTVQSAYTLQLTIQ